MNGRRDQIVAAATARFSEQGYASASLDDIAADIGFTKPAIYHWFGSKAAILFEIHDRIVVAALDRVRTIRAEGGAPERQLRAILEQHVETVIANAAANRVYDRERHHLTREQRRSIRRRERRYEREVREVYADGVTAGTLQAVDPVLAVGTLLGACTWPYRWARSDGDGAVTARAIVALLADGFLSPTAEKS